MSTLILSDSISPGFSAKNRARKAAQLLHAALDDVCLPLLPSWDHQDCGLRGEAVLCRASQLLKTQSQLGFLSVQICLPLKTKCAGHPAFLTQEASFN